MMMLIESTVDFCASVQTFYTVFDCALYWSAAQGKVNGHHALMLGWDSVN